MKQNNKAVEKGYKWLGIIISIPPLVVVSFIYRWIYMPIEFISKYVTEFIIYLGK